MFTSRWRRGGGGSGCLRRVGVVEVVVMRDCVALASWWR